MLNLQPPYSRLEATHSFFRNFYPNLLSPRSDRRVHQAGSGRSLIAELALLTFVQGSVRESLTKRERLTEKEVTDLYNGFKILLQWRGVSAGEKTKVDDFIHALLEDCYNAERLRRLCEHVFKDNISSPRLEGVNATIQHGFERRRAFQRSRLSILRRYQEPGISSYDVGDGDVVSSRSREGCPPNTSMVCCLFFWLCTAGLMWNAIAQRQRCDGDQNGYDDDYPDCDNKQALNIFLLVFFFCVVGCCCICIAFDGCIDWFKLLPNQVQQCCNEISLSIATARRDRIKNSFRLNPIFCAIQHRISELQVPDAEMGAVESKGAAP